MLRTPKRSRPRCTCGLCRVCTDPISTNMAALRTALSEPDEPQLGGKTVQVPARVAAPMPLPTLNLPARPAPDLDTFRNDMDELTNRIRQPRPDDRK